MPWPIPLLPISARILDADLSLEASHTTHRSVYSGSSTVVRRSSPVYRGRIRIRCVDSDADDALVDWLETHFLTGFGIQVWRFDGGHDLERFPTINSVAMAPGAMAVWTLDANPDAAWLNRLVVASGRAYRIVAIAGTTATVMPGVGFASTPVTPDHPATAVIRVQQVAPSRVPVSFRNQLSQDVVLEVVESPGLIAGLAPAPDGALVWRGQYLLWRGDYLIWNPTAPVVPEVPDGALTWRGNVLTWRGNPLIWKP